MFSTPTGLRIDPKRDYLAWRAILDAAGVSPARLHDARHTAATLYLEAGVQERVVQHQFGWSSPAMLPTYQHPTESLAREASDSITKGLLGDGPEDSLSGASRISGGCAESLSCRGFSESGAV